MSMSEELRLLERLRAVERKLELSQEYVKKLERKIIEFEAEHGERIVKTGMNRQGRVAGDSQWIDFNAMTFDHVARTLAQGVGSDVCHVEVRDVQSPHLVWPLTVDRREVYQVRNLRTEAKPSEETTLGISEAQKV